MKAARATAFTGRWRWPFPNLRLGSIVGDGGTTMDWETIGFWDGASDDFHGPESSPLELARYVKGFREGTEFQRKR